MSFNPYPTPTTPENLSTPPCPMTRPLKTPNCNLDLLTPPLTDEISKGGPGFCCQGHSDTPRTHYTSSPGKLSSEVRLKLRIVERGPGEGVRKRCWLVSSSPKQGSRKRPCLLDSPEKYPTEKENSPIKLVGSSSWNGFFANKPLLGEPTVVRVKNTVVAAREETQVDFLRRLEERNMFEIVRVILGHLSAKDLINVRAVSRCWRRLCLGSVCDVQISEYKNSVLTAKENLCATDEAIRESEKTPTKRFPLFDYNKVRKARREILKSPLLSPNSKRFNYFLKEGEKLNRKEILQKCPRCQFPARVTSSSVAECVMASCQYRFCPQCRCSAHLERKCNYFLTSSPQRQQKDVICSRASVRRLKRLC